MSEDASLLKVETSGKSASQSANADKTLIPYLKSRGVGKLDAGLDPYRSGPYGRYGGGCQTNPS